MTPLIRKPQIARPKKRIDMKVDNDRLVMQPPRPLTNFDVDRRGPKRRLRVENEEESATDNEGYNAQSSTTPNPYAVCRMPYTD